MYPKQLIIHKLLIIILTSFNHVDCSSPRTEEPPSILDASDNNASSTVYITTTTTTTAKTTVTTTTTKGFKNPNVPSGRLTFDKLADYLLVKNLTNNNNNNNSTNSSHQSQPPSTTTTLSTIVEPYFYINGHPVVQLSNLTMEHFSHPLIGGDTNNATTTTTTTTTSKTTTTVPSSINDCVDGRTYWNDRLQSCQTCMKQCPKGAMIQRPCNRSNNLECVCAKGYYMSIVDGTCKPCSECPSGYGVWRTCRWSRNTVCRQCQPGTYSGVSVGTLGCIPCSKCGPNQEMISGCDGDHDTVCIDRSSLMDSYLNSIDDGQMPPSTYFSNGMVQLQQQQQQQQSSSATGGSNGGPNFDRITTTTYPNGHGLPFYIALLVAIVFAFCLYALIQLRCNHSLMITNHHRNTDQMMVNGHHSKLSKNINLRSTECGSLLACPIHHSYTVPASWMATLATQRTDHWIPYQSGSPVSTDSVMPLFSNDHHTPPPQQHHNNMHNKMTRKFHKPSSAKYKTYYELLLGPNTVNHHHPTTTNTNAAAAPANIGQQNVGKPTNNNNNKTESMQSIPLISDDVEHLTIEIRQALESLLGKDTETWRLLARELGYDEQHIVQFEAKSATISNGHTIFDTFKSIRLLLLDWSSQMTTSPDDQSRQPDLSSNCTAAASSSSSLSSSSPSLATLTNALIRIGRVDCARIVVRQNQTKQTPAAMRQ